MMNYKNTMNTLYGPLCRNRIITLPNDYIMDIKPYLFEGGIPYDEDDFIIALYKDHAKLFRGDILYRCLRKNDDGFFELICYFDNRSTNNRWVIPKFNVALKELRSYLWNNGYYAVDITSGKRVYLDV